MGPRRIRRTSTTQAIVVTLRGLPVVGATPDTPEAPAGLWASDPCGIKSFGLIVPVVTTGSPTVAMIPTDPIMALTV